MVRDVSGRGGSVKILKFFILFFSFSFLDWGKNDYFCNNINNNIYNKNNDNYNCNSPDSIWTIYFYPNISFQGSIDDLVKFQLKCKRKDSLWSLSFVMCGATCFPPGEREEEVGEV